ncbi:CAP domain-containing protein [Mycobacterium sp. TY814]|nr:CAP domain-containing protein [Mycobacterium sp. TY814]MDP7724621.1 CAP domain-containing protein [Mycobacterium sp. TY814]
MRRLVLTLSTLSLGVVSGMATAHADNKRLNDSVVANVFTVQHQAGCKNDVRINPQLQFAAQRHTLDVLNNRNLNGDIGSDGSTPQDRAAAAGYRGKVAETVAINPAMAISGVELLNQWYYEPAYFAIMSNCANSQIGVWSENSPDRTVVVAVYGQPDAPTVTPPRSPSAVAAQENIPLDPRPDYDATDEIEYAVDWFPWILRGVNPPPGIPPE